MKKIVSLLIIVCLIVSFVLTQATPVFAKVKMDPVRYDRTIIVDPVWLWDYSLFPVK